MKNHLKFVALASLTAFALWIGIGTQAVSAKASPAAAAGFGPCYDQRNMAEALEHLHQARAALDRAEHNKGGWRDNAIRATDNAIHETEHGCAVANR